MSKYFTRRQFLRSGLILGAGYGVRLSHTAFPKSVSAQEDDAETSLALTGSIRRVHDPVMIEEEGTYYLFCTGRGIPVRKSDDLLDWKQAFPPSVFAGLPDWAAQAIPGASDIWAPDISYYNGKYHLYYSVSTFGSNRSLIGLATNKTLNFESDDFEWVDEGMVIESVRTDNYNCIDPNLILDEEGTPWLAFGSFWSGIKMIRLDLETGKPSEEDDTLYSLAQRTVNYGAVEAPFIIRKGDFYYLFVSFDSCCRGTDSTYRVMVGRSEAITGPYIDQEGVALTEGGGTQITFPTERWRGPGHNAILQTEDTDYIIYHAYDAENTGVPTLRINPLVWDEDGWPAIQAPA